MKSTQKRQAEIKANTTWLVIVNKKYLVKVDGCSAIMAEHKILDNVTCIKSALAFDPVKEAAFYAWAYAECEVISYAELCNKANNLYANRCENYNELLDEKWHYEAEVKRLEEKLAQERANLADVTARESEFAEKYFMRGYTSKERIAELRASTAEGRHD